MFALMSLHVLLTFLFPPCAQPYRELSFKKGDFLDLLHSIDDNWLEAKLPGGGKGNIPRSYIKVRDGAV